MMWPIALGLVVRAAGLSPHDGALVAAHSSITGPAWAAVRLLGLDPFVVIEQIASLVDDIDEVSLRADLLAATVESPHELPSVGSLLQDISAEHHASWEVRLFVS
jgi:urease accessory protein